jgi:zinc transporter
MDKQVRPSDDVEHDGPLLFGRVLDGQGGASPIGWEAAQHWRRGLGHEVLWLHFDRTVPGMQAWLEAHGISEPTAELLTSDDTRPRAFREGQTLVATLRGVNLNPGAEPEDMVSILVWSDGVRVFTLRRHSMQTTRELARDLDEGHGPRDAGGLITSLIERMIARMNHSIVDMNEAIDRLRRYLDDINISKESAVVLLDELRTITAARSERTNFLLTVVASIFLPLTFITGLIGMNVVGIPYASHPYSFWAIVAVCAAIALVQLWLFRRWKWL